MTTPDDTMQEPAPDEQQTPPIEQHSTAVTVSGGHRRAAR